LINRRQFLKGAALTGAAFALPWPTTWLGANTPAIAVLWSDHDGEIARTAIAHPTTVFNAVSGYSFDTVRILDDWDHTLQVVPVGPFTPNGGDVSINWDGL
jgi:FtsP/CotA-like multicopper oxidase with cupredoxin domain